MLGTLEGRVSAAGVVSLDFKGKSAARLTAGRYRIVVTDRSASNGFVLERARHPALTVTGLKFVGRHSETVALSAGRWLYTPGQGKKSYALVVRSG